MPAIQPSLPVHEDPRSVDYFPLGDDDVPWTVKRWPDLKQTFGLETHELSQWHLDLAGQGRYWKVVKRIYGVMAHFGEASEDEDQEEWDWKKLSARESVPEKVLKQELADIVEFWEKQRVSRRLRPSSTPSGPVNPVDSPPMISPAGQLTDQAIDDILLEYRFEHLKKRDRLFAVRRITELRSIFEDKNRRESARQLLNMELMLGDLEQSRALLKGRLDTLSELSGRRDLDDKQAAEIQKIQDSLDKNEVSHTKLVEKYLKAAAELGADEIEQGDLRKVAIGTVSHFVEAQRQYRQRGDRELIDGIFAADEIVWLTTPISMRPAQYRPDLVLRIREAMEPENLWNPDYKPTVIQREAVRRMLRLSKSLVEEEDPAPIPDIDDVSTASDETDDAAAHTDVAPPDPAPGQFTSPPLPPAQAESCIALG